MALQAAQGSQAQVLIGTRPGASNDEVQSVAGTLATAVSTGQFLYDLRGAGEAPTQPFKPGL
jgi:hypothetical protein